MTIYLDFDGVLCDSVEESFISSYLAFNKKKLKEDIYKDLSWRNSYKETLSQERHLFKSYRPFIKGAEDFMVLQKAISQGVFLTNEKDYLEYRETNLKGTDREELYKVRELIYREDPSWWYSLNHLYSGIVEFLLKVKDNEKFIILSTKEGDYIKAILNFYAIDFPRERIITELKKISYISSQNNKESILVDDQRKYGDEASSFPNIIFYLSTWGYILKEWLEDSSLKKITLNQINDLIEYAQKQGN